MTTRAQRVIRVSDTIFRYDFFYNSIRFFPIFFHTFTMHIFSLFFHPFTMRIFSPYFIAYWFFFFSFTQSRRGIFLFETYSFTLRAVDFFSLFTLSFSWWHHFIEREFFSFFIHFFFFIWWQKTISHSQIKTFEGVSFGSFGSFPSRLQRDRFYRKTNLVFCGQKWDDFIEIIIITNAW